MLLDLKKLNTTPETKAMSLNEITKLYALQVLEKYQYNVSAACRELVITRTKLYNILGGPPERKYEGPKRPKLELTLARLTPKQLMIKDLMLKGLSHSEIAKSVGLTVKGVKYNNTIIYKVYQVKSRAQLVAKLLGAV